MAKLVNGRLVYERISSLTAVQANYLASKQDEHVIDDLIAGYTGLLPCNWGTPPYSHTEYGVFVDGELWFFTSTSRKELNGGTGTRWSRANFVLRNPDRWELQIKEFSEFEIHGQIARAISLIGQPYDFVGVFADFTLPLDIIKKKKSIYCSKAIRHVWTGEHTRVSPRQQSKWAAKNGWRKVSGTKTFLAAMIRR
ncbi:MAG: hypothetical protein JW947_08385 [Sedimentisphaerales bacterium]|nr:hypothetical protein [Sedimentisphaerales bacterium]